MAIQNPERFMAGTVPKSNGLHRGTEAHPPVSSEIQVVEPMESFFARNFILLPFYPVRSRGSSNRASHTLHRSLTAGTTYDIICIIIASSGNGAEYEISKQH